VGFPDRRLVAPQAMRQEDVHFPILQSTVMLLEALATGNPDISGELGESWGVPDFLISKLRTYRDAPTTDPALELGHLRRNILRATRALCRECPDNRAPFVAAGALELLREEKVGWKRLRESTVRAVEGEEGVGNDDEDVDEEEGQAPGEEATAAVASVEANGQKEGKTSHRL
jgi:hypothetical protein